MVSVQGHECTYVRVCNSCGQAIYGCSVVAVDICKRACRKASTSAEVNGHNF